MVLSYSEKGSVDKQVTPKPSILQYATNPFYDQGLSSLFCKHHLGLQLIKVMCQ